MALGVGCTVQYNGTEYTLAPLTFRDYAKIVAHNKSSAFRIYEDVNSGKRTPHRLRDINAILCRGTREDDLSMSNPETLFVKVGLSLRKAHPKLTDDELDKMLTDDAFRETLCEVMEVINEGPLEFTDTPQTMEDGEPTANPTGT
jgi:hypothetical protein